MFNKKKVTDNLVGLVGCENPINPDYAILDVNNTESRSGRFATENPYFKIEYLKDTQDYKDASDIEFNTFLLGLQKSAIAEVMDKVLMPVDYIDRQLLYQYTNNKTATDTLPASSFVGYRLTKSLEKNVAFELPRIILEFEGTGDVELLLFNSAVKDPIFSTTVSITKTQQVEKLGWRIDDTGNTFQGEWYLGYLTDGLTVAPIKRDYQKSNCKSVITHLCYENIQVGDTIVNELFDLDDIESAEQCWGLNPDTIVFNDYTDLVIQHEALFAAAIQGQMVINGIQHYIASLRSSRTQRMSEDQLNLLIAQLEGIPDRIAGLIPTLHKEVRALNTQIERVIKGMFSTGFELNTLS
jgi:hypothetical protein